MFISKLLMKFIRCQNEAELFKHSAACYKITAGGLLFLRCYKFVNRKICAWLLSFLLWQPWKGKAFVWASMLLPASLRYQFKGKVELSPMWLWNLDYCFHYFLTLCYVDESCPCWGEISPTPGIAWFIPQGTSWAPTMRPLRNEGCFISWESTVGCMYMLVGKMFYGCTKEHQHRYRGN